MNSEKYLTFGFLLFILLATTGYGQDVGIVSRAAQEIVNPSWASKQLRRHAFIISLASAQTTSGFCEAYYFRQNPTYFVNASNYHIMKTARDLSMVCAGYSAYLNLQDKHQTRKEKIGLILGTAFIGRDLFEASYRYGRYGNPFDYSAAHNRNSIILFNIVGWKLKEVRIGTNAVSGPWVDLGFAVAGIGLINLERIF